MGLIPSSSSSHDGVNCWGKYNHPCWRYSGLLVIGQIMSSSSVVNSHWDCFVLLFLQILHIFPSKCLFLCLLDLGRSCVLGFTETLWLLSDMPPDWTSWSSSRQKGKHTENKVSGLFITSHFCVFFCADSVNQRKRRAGPVDSVQRF